MKTTYKTQGTCSREIKLEIENDIIKSVAFVSGCDGNLKGLSRLVVGMHVKDVIEKVKGIHCGQKSTSCPDQLAKALEQWQIKNGQSS